MATLDVPNDVQYGDAISSPLRILFAQQLDMESNKDEAIKCLSIAQRYRDQGNYASARKFCQKSINLFSTPEALRMLEKLTELENPGPQNGDASAESTSAETHPSASGAHHRHTNASASSSGSSKKAANGTASGSGGEKRDFTPDQLALVKRVRSCKVTEYYEILSVKKDCEEAEVKKAYRKLALQLHPDKNGAPGADEAFKMVSKAFQVLSDADKRAAFDRHGSDPESRFAGMQSASTNGRAGFAQHPFAAFDDELSPEDLFNMFFGGGGMGGGSPFGGPVFSASFGPGGFRTTRVNMGGRRAQPQARQGPQEPMSLRTVLTQLAPLILLFVFTFLSAVPNLFGSSGTPDPRYSFTPSTRFNAERQTPNLNVNYFVNKAEFETHPISEELAKVANGKSDGRTSLLNRFERNVEQTYMEQIYMSCQRDQERQQRRKEQKMGFLGIGADLEGIKAIDAEKIPSCEELRRLRNR